MENEEDLVNILIDDVPYITYNDFIRWLLDGDDIYYLSPYAKIPSWLIIGFTYYLYKTYCTKYNIIKIMKDIDDTTYEYKCNKEDYIGQRIFLFNFACGGTCAYMCDYYDKLDKNGINKKGIMYAHTKWIDQSINIEILKNREFDLDLGCTYDDKLLIMSEKEDIKYFIKKHFTLIEDTHKDILEIVILVDRLANVNERKGIHNLLPSLGITNEIKNEFIFLCELYLYDFL